jgi:hypothetical protein
MTHGARTPEELETLLEDALITHDAETLAAALEPDGLLIGDAFIAGRSRVLQACDTALLIAEESIGVALRRDGRWRFAIALLETRISNGATR